ncbi:MAG TPA: Ldh family oxidoreductase [Chloroflexota bacterium]|nr:Ldh family oxidoreductase [Chloroflexota bacterium]
MLVRTPEQLRDVATAIFLAAGADEEITSTVVEHLIDANLTGHDSHGVIRIPSYVRAIKEGQIVPTARPEVVRETAAMTLIDARHGFGHVSALFATDAVVAKARQHGVAIAGTFHGNHIGRLGYYPTRAASQGVALLVAYGALGRSGAPYGGRSGALGTNPISFGFPAPDDEPFLLDFATTAIAGGKVMVARAKHEPLPPNTMVDKDGRPTTDPNALSQGGALLPFGGHKGYALSLMTVLLSSVLVRADDGEAGRGGSKVFFCAIDSGVFGPGAPGAAAEVFERVRAVPPAEGFERVLIPGEPERRSAARRRTEGIPVAEDTWQSLTATAAELGVSL